MLTEQEVRDRVNSRFRASTIAKAEPKPHKISVDEYGHHASYVEEGHRIWGFVERSSRDKFVERFDAKVIKP